MNPMRWLSLIILVAALPAAGAKTWIFFADKGQPTSLEWRTAERNLLPRAQARRAKVYPPFSLVDISDLPVRSEYVRALQQLGAQVHVQSRWLNAVSITAEPAQLAAIAQIPFVKEQKPVLAFKRREVAGDRLAKYQGLTTSDYGVSLTQNAMMKVPEVHNLGITGHGVLIAVFDTGFRLNHEAFASLRVLAKYDFIKKDNNPDLEAGDPSSQISHGTLVLSTLAGYRSGHLIGPAFDAEYILAKTEDVSQEKPIEEDHWIAAAEWADSLGADIISSSLGYNDWYSYESMDGNTAPITRAADLAVKKGIVVVTAAGNEGNSGWRYILAPADGDSVIAVGAVYSNGGIVGFSSRGPSYDGRIKPDIVAMGAGVSCVAIPPATGTGTAYTTADGTSLATPLAAGVAALLLSAHPDLTPMQVREALLKTADRAVEPDNNYGYGLIDALAAIQYWGAPVTLPEAYKLVSIFPNPFAPERGYLRIMADLAAETRVQIDVYNLLGQQVATVWNGTRGAGGKRQWLWDGRDRYGRRLNSGVYLLQFRAGSYRTVSRITVLQ